MSVDGNLFQRSIIIVLATLSAIFWLLFAIAEFPWTVPADHIDTLVSKYERAAIAGSWLFVLSLATVCLAAGFFGNAGAMWLLSVVLFITGIGVCPLLYPNLYVLEYPYRLFAHILLMGLVLYSCALLQKSTHKILLTEFHE